MILNRKVAMAKGVAKKILDLTLRNAEKNDGRVGAEECGWI
jgi:hypothetical protein